MKSLVLSMLFLFSVINCGAQEAPDFEFTKEDGTKVMLSDYRGKVVYISFWASWCAPCITNFKKYADIRSKLAEAGVSLLNISIDVDLQKWKSSMANQNIKGDQGYVRKEDIYPDYKISSIPLYEIIDKEGNLRYLSDAGNRDILGQFREWVNR